MANRFIDKLAGYTSLSEGAIAALTHATANAKSIDPRQDLIREGDTPGPILVILEGWACRYKILPSGSRQIMAFLMPGDSCDLHVDLLTEMDHSIQTTTACRVATVKGEVMNMIFDDHPEVMRAMYLAQLR